MNTLSEIFKPIKGYEGLYEVSNFGRVKSLPRKWRSKEKILKSGKSSGGYELVVLARNNKAKTFRVHRIVAQEFVKNPKNKRTVNHKNGIKVDNRVENLEWATQKENVYHAWENGMSSNERSKKKVAQIKDGKIIKVWGSLTNANNHLKISWGGISRCCSGDTKSSGGFQWKFINT